ncbi:MAG: nitrilase-related carbon-nitrogen hydrolase [Acidimicrobiales bacterium]|jgi:predicted amidohydrolase
MIQERARVRIAPIQCDIVWEDAPANHERFGDRITAATDAGARLVLLPEMFATGFSMATERVAEAEDGTTTTFLCRQATSHGIWAGGSFACGSVGCPAPVNRFLVAAPDGSTAAYDKVHPSSPGGEADRYVAGDRPVTFQVDDLRVTPFVCDDLRTGDWFCPPRSRPTATSSSPTGRRLFRNGEGRPSG